MDSTKFMRVMLRRRDQALYFQEPDQWTRNSEEASTFNSSGDAVNFARAKRLPTAELLVAFEDALLNFTIQPWD
jgi:hypothetical protein